MFVGPQISEMPSNRASPLRSALSGTTSRISISGSAAICSKALRIKGGVERRDCEIHRIDHRSVLGQQRTDRFRRRGRQRIGAQSDLDRRVGGECRGNSPVRDVGYTLAGRAPALLEPHSGIGRTFYALALALHRGLEVDVRARL